MRRTILAATLGAAFLLAAATGRAADRRPRVAVLWVKSGVPAELKHKLEGAVAAGLTAAGADTSGVRDTTRKLGAKPDLAGCESAACLVEIGQLTAAPYLVRGWVDALGSNYNIRLEIVEAASGKVLAQESSRCDICNHNEVVDAASLSASALKARALGKSGGGGATGAGTVAATQAPSQPSPSSPLPASVVPPARPGVSPAPPTSSAASGTRVPASPAVSGAPAPGAIVAAGAPPPAASPSWAGAPTGPMAATMTAGTAAPAAPVATASVPTSATPAAPPSSDGGSRVLPWTLIGAGAVAAGVGITLVALDGKGTCSPNQKGDACPDRYKTMAGGVSLLAAGLAAAGVGGYLLWAGGRERGATVAAAPDGVLVRGWF